jgi:hypothetical protein
MAMSNGQQIENLRAWAFTVARNKALNARTSLPAFASLEPAIEDRLAAESPSPEQSVLDREKLRRLWDAIRLLSDQQRHCLHLRTKGNWLSITKINSASNPASVGAVVTVLVDASQLPPGAGAPSSTTIGGVTAPFVPMTDAVIGHAGKVQFQVQVPSGVQTGSAVPVAVHFQNTDATAQLSMAIH